MTPDNELLRQYAQTGSEEAFAELVQRHVNLVYSAGLRQVAGDEHLAHDVAQNVFTDLARKAASLSRRENLTGWLYTSAYFAAGKIARAEHRRREREEQFMNEPTRETAPDADWEQLRPVLDEAMHELNETDREAVLLRYFENRAFGEVGVKLGVGENAARMRVERALEKLRSLLSKRGIATTAALASAISANAVQTAPTHLVTTLTSASIAGAGSGTFTFMKLISTTKVKLALGALALGGATTAIVIQHQAQETLRTENASLQQQIAQLKAQNDALSNPAVQNTNVSPDQLNELLKLRAEVTTLRQQSAARERLQSNLHTAKLQPDTNLPVVLDAPTVALTPASGWANVGSASPAATMQTLYWAMAAHDEKSLSSLVAWDPDAQAKLQALFDTAPEAVRERFGSIDGVLYTLLSSLPPISGFAVVSQNVQGDDDILVEQHQYDDGRVRQNQVTLHRFVDGWRVVFGDEKLMRGFDAALKRAAAYAQQPAQ